MVLMFVPSLSWQIVVLRQTTAWQKHAAGVINLVVFLAW
jgi:hypothetical protein